MHEAEDKNKRSKAKGAAHKRRSLTKEIQEEKDPLWRNWFLQIEEKKKNLSNPKTQPFIYSTTRSGEMERDIVRRRSELKSLEKFIKLEKRKESRIDGSDIDKIESTWKSAVGYEIAEASTVHSFKKGVLTITIFSSSLLQEIRQFCKPSILKEVRNQWQIEQPLLRIDYQLGKADN